MRRRQQRKGENESQAQHRGMISEAMKGRMIASANSAQLEQRHDGDKAPRRPFIFRAKHAERAEPAEPDDQEGRSRSDRHHERAAYSAVLEGGIRPHLLPDEITGRAEREARPRHEAVADCFRAHSRGTQ